MAIFSTLKSDLSLEKSKLTQNKHNKMVKLVSDPVNKGFPLIQILENPKKLKGMLKLRLYFQH